MAKVLLFTPRARLEAAAQSETSPTQEVIDWCLMILAQTDERELDIPLSRSFSAATLYEVVCHFKGRGLIVTTDGPRNLKFKRAS